METKEIQENNKLIAEFMGVQNGTIKISDTHKIYAGQMNGMEEYSFHRMWSMLMPVVEKIEAIVWINDPEDDNRLLTWGEHPFAVTIEASGCKIKVDADKTVNPFNWHYPTNKNKIHTKLDATHSAVVEFIKWYNEQANS